MRAPVFWSAVAERSGDTAFGRGWTFQFCKAGACRKRRGASLPAAVQDAIGFAAAIQFVRNGLDFE